MEFHDVVERRCSIRAYHPEPVGQDKLDRILEAARRAPSACNKQPWHIYVVRDSQTRAAICRGYGGAWLTQAPVIVVVCGRASEAWQRVDGRPYLDVDVAILADHLILAAANEGLGTCWIAAFDPQVVAQALALPPDLEPIILTPIGHANQPCKQTERKPLSQIVTVVG